MEKFKFLEKEKLAGLPKSPGVYVFKKGAKLLYIGKAGNIKERVKNHFRQPSPKDNLLLNQLKLIGYIKTDSEIEALLLESRLIKKHQPRYNVMWKDDKNYFHVGISNGPSPKVYITHQPETGGQTTIGPFVDGRALKETLSSLRKVFPYYTIRKHPETLCPWCHLKLCPGPNPDKKEYKKNIKNLIKILEGKKQSVLRDLKREMKILSASQDYEKAAITRDQLGALEKVISNAKIFRQSATPWHYKRIEAYDVSNIQGKEATGAMVTFINGKPDKNFYRRFKIKMAAEPNDVAMLKECLARRFKHQEWPYPDLILIDGGKAQLNISLEAKREEPKAKNIKFMALAKKHNELFIEGRKRPLLLKDLARELSDLILQLRDEAHRFAISYHRKLRAKSLL